MLKYQKIKMLSEIKQYFDMVNDDFKEGHYANMMFNLDHIRTLLKYFPCEAMEGVSWVSEMTCETFLVVDGYLDGKESRETIAEGLELSFEVLRTCCEINGIEMEELDEAEDEDELEF